jgi:hypothetical protein
MRRKGRFGGFGVVTSSETCEARAEPARGA